MKLMFFVDTITKSCRERLVKELSLLFLRKNNNLNYFLYHCQPYNCSKGSKKMTIAQEIQWAMQKNKMGRPQSPLK